MKSYHSDSIINLENHYQRPIKHGFTHMKPTAVELIRGQDGRHQETGGRTEQWEDVGQRGQSLSRTESFGGHYTAWQKLLTADTGRCYKRI